MAKEKLWQIPSLRIDEEKDKHRKVSWLELFFDLFFVVTVSQISHTLAGEMNIDGLRNFVLLFIPMWWVWIGATFYIERFETIGIEMRIFTFLLMIPVAGLAVFAHDGLGKTYTLFTLSYAAARILITFMWIRSGIHERQFRKVAFFYAAGFSISIILTIISNLFPYSIAFILFGAALLIDLVTPIFTAGAQKSLPRYSSSRLPERFGLFVIIVLGESVVSVVNGISSLSFVYPHIYATGILGLAIAFCIWWIYFDSIARKSFKPGIPWTMTWSYLHLPLVMSYAAMGASMLYIIWHGYTVDYNPGRILYSFALGTSLIITGLLEKTLRDETGKSISAMLKISAGLFSMLFSLFAARFDTVLMLICLLCLLLLQIGYGIYVRIGEKE
jgi:low temperature requirement protein LtrA